MEVHLTAKAQAKLDQMARVTGRASQELLEDAVTGLFDEFTLARQTRAPVLRELGSSQAKSAPADGVLSRLRARSAARRAGRA